MASYKGGGVNCLDGGFNQETSAGARRGGKGGASIGLLLETRRGGKGGASKELILDAGRRCSGSDCGIGELFFNTFGVLCSLSLNNFFAVLDIAPAARR